MYDDLVELREIDIDGETNWWWIKIDNGAWDGPKQNWEEEHRHKYFEHVKKYDVVLCAGANQGMYARHYAKKFKQVYAFEPDPLNFHCLVRNCPFDNVHKFQAALGERSELVCVNRACMENTGMHRIVPAQDNATIPGVICMTIDSLNLPVLDFLQLDVEGYEYPALIGAAETLTRCRPVLALENGRSEKFHTYLKSFGYEHKGNSVSDDIWVPVY